MLLTCRLKQGTYGYGNGTLIIIEAAPDVSLNCFILATLLSSGKLSEAL
jgi:hypothetical protein